MVAMTSGTERRGEGGREGGVKTSGAPGAGEPGKNGEKRQGWKL